jgi:hypothetical protein
VTLPLTHAYDFQSITLVVHRVLVQQSFPYDLENPDQYKREDIPEETVTKEGKRPNANQSVHKKVFPMITPGQDDCYYLVSMMRKRMWG